jgi:predicted PurR-regulated permease PerM
MKLHVLQISAYLIIIAAGMKAAAPVVNVILLALLLAMSMMPVILWLMKKGVPKAVSLLITIFLLIFVTGLIASILSAAAFGIAEKIPQYEQQLLTLKTDVIQFLLKVGIDVSSILSHQLYNPENLMGIATDFISGIISTFSNFTIVFLLIIFLLIDTAGLRYKIHKGEKTLSKGLFKFTELADEIRKYISISAFTGLLTAIGNLILLLILGVDFPFLWAFLSLLFSFIPNIGFILSVIPPAFLALAESGITEAIIIVIGFVIINAIVENIIKPKFMGEELNLSLFVIFVSLIVWTWILGAMGAILAIPLTISAMKAREILFSDSD